MKKSQPSTSKEPSIQQLVQHYSGIGSPNRAPYSARGTRGRRPLSADDASSTVDHSTESPTEDNTTGAAQRERNVHPGSVVPRAAITLSEEQISKLVPYNQLVQAFKEDVERYCHSVYGNKRALWGKVQAIQANPRLGKDLAWQLALHPESFAKLAGRNVCGIKNRARRRAEEDILPLCEAIEQYTSIVDYARGCLREFTSTELKFYEKTMGGFQLSQILQDSSRSERGYKPLSDAELNIMVQKDPLVQKLHSRIEYWCQIAFGNSNALSEPMRELSQDPSTRRELIPQLAAQPESFHKLAGFQMCCIKNKARAHAEAALPRLLDSVGGFADAVQQTRENILQQQQVRKRYSKVMLELFDKFQQKKSRSLEDTSTGAEVTLHESAPGPTPPRKPPRSKALSLAL
ncbi:BID domain-containing T4SS effector [Bartonella phoceensis]|uniref:BID domain-containing T4SS effector n=1 Tax=Bartonella phoceensis TaxID=270249 RepID=UPI001ABB8AF2|nr:BID domain-containing T4SS effector [Bartonella phoceensis]